MTSWKLSASSDHTPLTLLTRRKGLHPRGGGGGGGRLGSKFARMCVSKSEGHGFFSGFKGVK